MRTCRRVQLRVVAAGHALGPLLRRLQHERRCHRLLLGGGAGGAAGGSGGVCDILLALTHNQVEEARSTERLGQLSEAFVGSGVVVVDLVSGDGGCVDRDEVRLVRRAHGRGRVVVVLVLFEYGLERHELGFVRVDVQVERRAEVRL